MTLEGRITIDLFPPQGRALIASSRPLSMPHRFSGRAPAEVIQHISLLFSICRAAQTVASAEAFETALGIETLPITRTVRRLLVLAETAREHGLRILMDWPRFLRDAQRPDTLALRSLMTLDRDFTRALDRAQAFQIGGHCALPGEAVEAQITALEDLIDTSILGEKPERWLKRATREDLREWAQADKTVAQRLLHRLFEDGLSDVGGVKVRMLPNLSAHCLAERLLAKSSDHFIAEPDWEGSPRETSPLPRNSHRVSVDALRQGDAHGLGARLVACLAELASLPFAMRALLNPLEADVQDPHANSAGIGVAQIEAARGRLVHAVEMNKDKVGRYRILAPTEWNFHPQGAAAQALARIAQDKSATMESMARLFVTAVDPCVAADVRVH